VIPRVSPKYFIRNFSFGTFSKSFFLGLFRFFLPFWTLKAFLFFRLDMPLVYSAGVKSLAFLFRVRKILSSSLSFPFVSFLIDRPSLKPLNAAFLLKKRRPWLSSRLPST